MCNDDNYKGSAYTPDFETVEAICYALGLKGEDEEKAERLKEAASPRGAIISYCRKNSLNLEDMNEILAAHNLLGLGTDK